MQKIAVIGLGRFGMELARQLGTSPAQVIAVDSNGNLVNEIKDRVDRAVRLDATDESALLAQEIDQVDVCVISIGENFEAALLALATAKRLGIPRVICRAQTAVHAEIFRQIGADEVIQPEMQAGANLARKLSSPHIEQFITLAEEFTLIELRAPPRFHGKTLVEIDLRRKYGVNLVAIKRPEAERRDGQVVRRHRIINVPRPEDVILADDVLVVVGSNDDLARLPRE